MTRFYSSDEDQMMLKNLKLDMFLKSEVKFASFSFKFPSYSKLMYMKEKKKFFIGYNVYR